ncbi:hypothetical protein RN001_011910 [Aquatica leii]|uniref:Uncharacterized protein n=1 Tax=Aquatica leii TaxID=1421715 RepID=A0AAN7SM84_9COLE|nr:hypothetical protein RN001_011910 [Aquatica leii]
MTEPKINEDSPFKHKLDTDDFLAFNDIPSSQEFCPGNSSSPQKQWLQQPRKNYQNNWGRRSSGNFRQNNSPQNYYNKSYNSFEYKQHKPYFKNNRSFDSSFNKSKNDSFSYGKSFEQTNASSYLHPSFMENPWAALEKQLEEESNKDADDLVCNLSNELEQET